MPGCAMKEKSSGEPVTPSKKGFQISLRRRLSEILRHQLQGEDTIFLEDELLPPMRVEQIIAVELQQPADQSTIGGIRMSLDGGVEGTEQRRQRMGFKGQPGDDAETAAASALDAPVEVRVHTAIGEAHLAVRRDDLRFQKARGCAAVPLRETAESAALHQAGDAHRGAAAALDVASVLSRDRIVDLHPNRSCLHRHRRPRVTECAAMGHEGIVDVDRVHRPGPDQQGISGIRCALIAVTAAFDDQPQVLGAGETHRCDDVAGLPGGNGIDTGREGPRVHPPQSLREAGLIADVIGISQCGEQTCALGAGRCQKTIAEW